MLWSVSRVLCAIFCYGIRVSTSSPPTSGMGSVSVPGCPHLYESMFKDSTQDQGPRSPQMGDVSSGQTVGDNQSTHEVPEMGVRCTRGVDPSHVGQSPCAQGFESRVIFGGRPPVSLPHCRGTWSVLWRASLCSTAHWNGQNHQPRIFVHLRAHRGLGADHMTLALVPIGSAVPHLPGTVARWLSPMVST